MILYVVSVMIGFVLAAIYVKKGISDFEKALWVHVHNGKTVMICVDSTAYMFTLDEKGKIKIVQGMADVNVEETEDVNSMGSL